MFKIFLAILIFAIVFIEVENYPFKICVQLCWNFDSECIETEDCAWQTIILPC